jgi:hypothetical protein
MFVVPSAALVWRFWIHEGCQKNAKRGTQLPLTTHLHYFNSAKFVFPTEYFLQDAGLLESKNDGKLEWHLNLYEILLSLPFSPLTAFLMITYNLEYRIHPANIT